MDIIEKYNNIKSIVPADIKGYERHFIRGLVDGDGYLNYRTNRKSFRINFVNKSYEIVDWMSKTLSLELEIDRKEPKLKARDNMYIIEWEGKVAKLIAWYLYHGDIEDCVLERKLKYFKKHVTNQHGIKSFFEATGIYSKKNHIVPVTSSKDSLYWCKILKNCLSKFFDINTVPVPVNKGTKKYYELYVPIANTQGLCIND